MIMKKGISILLLIAAMLSLASCGGTPTAQATPQPTTAPTAVETAAPASEEPAVLEESTATAAEGYLQSAIQTLTGCVSRTG